MPHSFPSTAIGALLLATAAVAAPPDLPLVEPESATQPVAENVATPGSPTPVTVASTLTIDEAERLALAASPSLAALAADVNAARWECVQAGLPPNPTAGYVGNEIGNDDHAGQQGAYLGQQFIRGGKLTYAQSVAAKEARLREQKLAIERRRLITDVRTLGYDVYLSQLELELASDLVELGERAVDTSQKLVKAGEGRKTDVLQAEIETQRALGQKRQAEAQLDAGWRRLAALTGLRADSATRIEADLAAITSIAPWESAAATLAATSPEVAARIAAIERAKCEVALQRSQVVPDVTAQVAVQYDDATDDTITSVQVGWPLMLWNRNQGGIGRAQAELAAARRRLETTEQSLERSLAEAYGRYERARGQAEVLATEVLPRADQTLKLASEGYAAGEVSFLELLTVQRIYFQVSLERIALLRQVNEAAQLVDGALLSGSGRIE